MFKDNHLNITIQRNLKIVNYRDITSSLSNATYRPFCKPNNEIAYIHKELNHQPSILRQIPLSIELTYQKSISNKNKDTKQRKRKTIWFTPLPPYSKNVSTKVGNQFLKLINKHFPLHHKFYKLFNKNNFKVSYSCMPNMKNVINKHNKKKINPPKGNIARTCNCIRKYQCPLNEKCLTNNVLY